MIDNVLKQVDLIATTQPKKVAYDELGEKHTYEQLKKASDSLAHALDELNLPEKAPVMVYGGQQFEMIASFLGSAKSGHAYIPVDVNSAEERLTDIIEIAKPAVILAIDELPTSISDILMIDKQHLDRIFSTNVPYELTHSVQENDNFYIIFTSGTTGRPKGVQISHHNLLSFTNWMIGDTFDWQEGSNVLSQPPYSFDLSVMDWVPTIVTGGTLKALPKSVAEDFKLLFATLPKLDLTTWVSTPSFADVALLDPEFNQANNPNLKAFLFCGEVLTRTTAEKLLARFPKVKIYNTYGPTEATVAVASIRITKEIIENYDKMPIGYVKKDTLISIQDSNDQEVSSGEKGEIVISGSSVSKGYLNNPEKTNDVFTKFNGEQAYKTGDLATVDENSLLHYKGRSDFQIKLHGFRIELEEVAQQLQQSQWIEQVVAVPRYDADGKVKQLLAIVVPKENDFSKPMLLTNAIKDGMKDIMMPYMMPSRFIYRESMPLTPNGKIDLKGLIAEVNGNA